MTVTRALVFSVALLAQTAPADTVARSGPAPHYNVAPGAPIASSVVVPAGCATAYLSGMGSWSPGEKMPSDFGDTEAQTNAALGNVQAELTKLNLSLANVVMLRVYLVADPARGKADFEGYSRAYKRFFGTTTQPVRPARATVEVAKLVVPGLLVEIEAIAAAQCSSGQDSVQHR